MARRSRPVRKRETAVPLRAFSLGQIHKRVARKRHRRRSVTLRAELRMMLARPRVQRSQIVLVNQLRQRPSPVVTHIGSLLRGPRGQLRQVRQKIVAAPRAKFLQQLRRPIRLVHFKAVAENGIRHVRPACLDQRVRHVLNVMLDRLHAEVVEHKSLRAHRRALHLLPCAAGNEKQRHMRTVLRPRRHAHPELAHRFHPHCVIAVVFLRRSRSQKYRQQFFAIANGRNGKGTGALRHSRSHDTQFSRSLVHRHIRSAIRPAAAQRHTQPQVQVVRRLRRKAHHVQIILRQKRQIAKSLRRIVQIERINRLHFHAAHAARLHGAQLAGQLTLLHRRPKPPPAHHRSRIHRRRGKAAANRGKGIGRGSSLLRGGGQCRQHHRKHNAGNNTKRAFSSEKSHDRTSREIPVAAAPPFQAMLPPRRTPRRSILISQRYKWEIKCGKKLVPQIRPPHPRVTT